MTEVPRLVLDANIIVSALLGTSFALFAKLVENGVELYATEAQISETRRILSERPQASPEWIDEQMARLATAIVQMSPAEYEGFEAKARLRLRERGQPDWPVLAASFETDAAVWSHDKDFFGSGAPVWSTFMLRRQLELAD